MGEIMSEKLGKNLEQTASKKMRLLKLFWSTLYLSAFTFGGGYVIVSLMKKKFVDELGWIDEEEMLDLVAIAQSTPGAIAVNGAIVVGYKLEGIIGVIAAIAGTIIPPFVIISVISFFYELFASNVYVQQVLTGMQAGVGAVIACVVFDMGSGIVRSKSILSMCIMIAAFIAGYVCNVNVVLIILACGALGAVLTLAQKEGAEMIYLQLFLSFLQIGAFSFGGGYAAMPLIQSQVVDSHKWLSMAEFTNLITISQMTPGPIAVNSATFVGLKVAGIGGAAIATAGCILPSCILVTLLAKLYLRYRKMDLLQGILGMLRPAVVALIASAGVSILVTAFWPEGMILIQKTQIDMVIIFIAAVYLIQFRKMNPVLVMVLSGVAKLGIYLVGTFLL